MKSQYDLTVFFYNPNIYPVEEYLKRKKEVVRVCEEWGVRMVDLDNAANTPQPPLRGELKNNFKQTPLEGGTGGVGGLQYGQEEWGKVVVGLENEPEGGARCSQCFKMRLEKTAQYANENNFDIFCTTLTSGKNKKAEVINSLGRMLAEKYGVKFFETDWKKGGRQEKGRKLVEERGIYRQKYCGCKYSLNDTDDFVRR